MKSRTWTRNDLVEKISSKVGLPNSTSSLIIENIFDFILSELENKQDVKISSFGSFIIRNKKITIRQKSKNRY